jgi:hypothetical protein
VPRRWTLLSNHGVALVVVARDPGIRLREIAETVGVTERTAYAIVRDLVAAGYLSRYRKGNRSRYEVNPEVPLRHPALADYWVGELLVVLASDKALLASRPPRTASSRPPPTARER